MGLLGVYGIFLFPRGVAVLAAVRVRLASGPYMIVLGLALFTRVYAIDLLFNGFPLPVQAVVAGALLSFAAAISRPAAGRTNTAMKLARDLSQLRALVRVKHVAD